MVATVVIVDPQPFFCESLAASLESQDVHVIGWTTDELDAERLTSSLAPDAVLTELNLGLGSGLALARRIRDRTRVIMLTRRHEGEVLLDSVAAGACGCVSHELDVVSLRRTIGEAVAGRFAIDPDRLHEVLRRATATAQNDGGTSNISRLTRREREVLRLLSAGMGDDGIARQLYLSIRTARTHVANILRKLEVHSRAEAVRLALNAEDGDNATHILRIEGPRLGGS